MLDPPTLLRWALAVWALAATSVTGAALGAPGTRAPAASASVAWAVQVSDLHISGFKHLAIAPDLVAFGESVLAALRPSALLLTGDLVDAKTASQEGSQQYPQEWQVGDAAWKLCRGPPGARGAAGRGARVREGRSGLMGARPSGPFRPTAWTCGMEHSALMPLHALR
jgi:hypothetical protein